MTSPHTSSFNTTQSTSKAALGTVMDRYILAMGLDNFVLNVVVFTFLLFFSDAFLDVLNEIQRYGIPLNWGMVLVALQLPKTMALVIPVSCFLAVLMTYNLLSNQLELVALRMAGASLERLLVPGLLLGVLATGMTGVLDEVIAPYCHQQTVALREALLGQGLLPVGRESFTLEDRNPKSDALNKVFHVSQYKGHILGASTLLDFTQPGMIQVIQARGGDWAQGDLTLSQANVYTLSRQTSNLSFNHSDRLFIPSVLSASLAPDETVPPVSAANAATAELEASLSEKNTETLNILELFGRLQARLAHGLPVANRSWVLLWEKLTLPLSALAFVVVAMPLALNPPRNNGRKAFVVALGSLFLFYVLRAIAVSVSRSDAVMSSFGGVSPVVAILLVLGVPLVLMTLWGLWLLRQKRYAL